MSGSDRRRKLPAVLGLLPSAWQHEPPSEPPLGTPAGPPCPATSGHFTRTTTKSQPHRPRIPRLVVSGLYPQGGVTFSFVFGWVVPQRHPRPMSRTARKQETLRRLAIFDGGFLGGWFG